MKKNTILLILGLLLLHVVAFSLMPLPDPSEARYATIAQQMVESGNYIMPQIWIKGELIPFMSKPPLAFWIMAGSIKIFGMNEFAVRLPAFIASLFLLGIIFWVLNKTRGRYVATVAVLITATSGGFYLLSGAVLVDMWLCLFSIGALFIYYLFIHEPELKLKKIYSLLVFILLAGAFLTKGPVGIIFFGLPVFFWTLLSNRWDTLKYHAWFLGLTLFLLLVIPWFVLAEQSTPGYLHYFFINENFMRFVSSNKSLDLYSGISHKMPLGMAIIYAIVVTLPWCVIQLIFYSIKKGQSTAFFSAAKQGWRKSRIACFKRKSADFDLFLVGLISITLFWSISSHIMLYYMLLIIPLFATWSATLFDKYKFPYMKIVNLTILLLVIYLLAMIPVYFILDAKKSTRAITLRALEYRQTHQLSGKLIFVRRLAYSAYFYGGNLIVPHGKESIEQSLTRQTTANNAPANDLYLISKRYTKRIPTALQAAFTTVYQGENWHIMMRKRSEHDE